MNHLHGRLTRVEKRSAPTKLKTNIVTAQNLAYKAVTKEAIAKEAVTPTETSFGVNLVATVLPTTNLKEGTTVTDPTSGATKVYDDETATWATVVDVSAATTAAAAAVAALAAQTTADGKNKIYRAAVAPMPAKSPSTDIRIPSRP